MYDEEIARIHELVPDELLAARLIDEVKQYSKETPARVGQVLRHAAELLESGVKPQEIVNTFRLIRGDYDALPLDSLTRQLWELRKAMHALNEAFIGQFAKAVRVDLNGVQFDADRAMFPLWVLWAAGLGVLVVAAAAALQRAL